MKHKEEWIKRGACLLIACALFAENTVPVWAEETMQGDEVTISETDRPYLSLGANLTAEQQHTVLELMGIEAENLEDYDVSYVTNEEEHEYLDSYISSKKIGKHALSSVVITQAEEGAGLSISTYNINYCTVGMYKNALTTAGITDANIIVAGPYEISGTAALVGVMKAYSSMTGDEIDEEVMDAALDELVTTGELEEDLVSEDVSSEDLEAFLADLKQELADGGLGSGSDMKEKILSMAEERGLKLSDSQLESIMKLLEKLEGLDLDWNAIADQAAYWAKKAGNYAKNISGDDVDSFFGTVASIVKKLLAFFQKLF